MLLLNPEALPLWLFYLEPFSYATVVLAPQPSSSSLSKTPEDYLTLLVTALTRVGSTFESEWRYINVHLQLQLRLSLKCPMMAS